jgi:hypothetical protein
MPGDLKAGLAGIINISGFSREQAGAIRGRAIGSTRSSEFD